MKKIIIIILSLNFLLTGCYAIKNDKLESPVVGKGQQEQVKPKVTKLEILPEWKSNTKDGYIYIEGSVKNSGDNPIKYFKIVAKYKDENSNVLDSDYTNSTEIILPGEQKKFEIMHKNDTKFKKVSLSVDEVK